MNKKTAIFLVFALAVIIAGVYQVVNSKKEFKELRDKETPVISVTPIQAVNTVQVVSVNDIDRLVITDTTKSGVKMETSASATISGKVYVVPVALHKLISKALGDPSYQIELRNDSVVALINTETEDHG